MQRMCVYVRQNTVLQYPALRSPQHPPLPPSSTMHVAVHVPPSCALARGTHKMGPTDSQPAAVRGESGAWMATAMLPQCMLMYSSGSTTCLPAPVLHSLLQYIVTSAGGQLRVHAGSSRVHTRQPPAGISSDSSLPRRSNCLTTAKWLLPLVAYHASALHATTRLTQFQVMPRNRREPMGTMPLHAQAETAVLSRRKCSDSAGNARVLTSGDWSQGSMSHKPHHRGLLSGRAWPG